MRSVPFDFHLHSCLSPCGGDDMTPANLAAMCALAGYEAVALTDHNTTRNCPAFCRAAAEHGLVALPGLELTCAEEVHIICLFPTLEGAMEFGAMAQSRLPKLANRPDFFGHQLVMDEGDGVLEEETALLAGATDLTVYEVAPLVAALGGVAYPAHIDRDAFSLLSNLGLWTPEAGFPLAEVSPRCPAALRRRPDLAGVPLITGCDAHTLDQIPDPTQRMIVPAPTPEHILTYLRF